MIIKCFQATGCLFLLLILYIGWFFAGKPVITTNYVEQMNIAVRPYPDVDPNLNAEPFYSQAGEIFEDLSKDEEERVGLWGEYILEDANESVKNDIWQVLVDYNDLFGLVAEGSKQLYYWPSYGPGQDAKSAEAIALIMPHLSNFRQFAYGLRWRAYLNAEKGNFKKAFDDLLVMYRFGSHFRGDKTLIEQLVGISLQALSMQSTRKIVSLNDVDKISLAEFQSKLEKLIDNESPIISFEMEKFFILDELQRSFTHSKIFGSHLYLKRVTNYFGYAIEVDEIPSATKTAIKVLFWHPDKQKLAKQSADYYDFIQNLSTKTPATLEVEKIDIELITTKKSQTNVLLKILAPAFGKVIQLGYRNKTDTLGTLTTIAILRYKKEKGRLPENLDGVVSSGYLKDIPVDPFSDKPLVYKRTEDGFILYSVGLNMVDDGGVWGTYTDCNGKKKTTYKKIWTDDGDAIFWPVLKKER